MNAREKITTNTHESKGADSATKARTPEASPSMDSPIGRILHLQRTIGNQAVQRMLKSRAIQARRNERHIPQIQGKGSTVKELAYIMRRNITDVIQREEGREGTPTLMEYEVVSGDTLGAIARRFGTTVSELKRINGLRSDTIRVGQRLQVPALQGCTINVPASTDEQLLTGVIFAEAEPRRETNDEREAIAWSFVNAVRHTNELCTGTICPSLIQGQRTDLCQIDTRDLGRTILDAIRIGSTAYNNDRWRMVMSGNALLPAANLCLLNPREQTALTRSITAASTVMGGGTAPDYVRFNRAANSPPSPRMERSTRIGSHTFYRFISGRECG